MIVMVGRVSGLFAVLGMIGCVLCAAAALMVDLLTPSHNLNTSEMRALLDRTVDTTSGSCRPHSGLAYWSMGLDEYHVTVHLGHSGGQTQERVYYISRCGVPFRWLEGATVARDAGSRQQSCPTTKAAVSNPLHIKHLHRGRTRGRLAASIVPMSVSWPAFFANSAIMAVAIAFGCLMFKVIRAGKLRLLDWFEPHRAPTAGTWAEVQRTRAAWWSDLFVLTAVLLGSGHLIVSFVSISRVHPIVDVNLMTAGAIAALLIGAVLFIASWWIIQRRSRPNRCAYCGYPRTGLPSRICPECGTRSITREREGRL